MIQTALLLLLLGLVQLVGSLLFYQAIDRQTLREDHARRIAELLVVSDRIHALEPGRTSAVMSTRHLEVRLADAPTVPHAGREEALQAIAAQVVRWEPGLGGKPLHLAYAYPQGGVRDLVGSIRLTDGKWLNFRSRDIGSMWPVALRAIVLTLIATLACLAIALATLRLLTAPLRRLTRAADAIGHGQRVEIDEQHGPADLRELAHAMNTMQERVARVLEDQARSFEAISHDLRTPLSRQRVAADLIDDPEIAAIMGGSVDEMEGLLSSLQGYLRAQHIASEAELVDLREMIEGVIAPFGDRVQFSAPSHASAATFVVPVQLTLSALVENAVRFGERAQVRLLHEKAGWYVEVEDGGPGIPPEHFDDVLLPFFRLDEARSRDVPGFGMGIPTAHRLMMRFGGRLSFSTKPGGGFIARMHLPILSHFAHGHGA